MLTAILNYILWMPIILIIAVCILLSFWEVSHDMKASTVSQTVKCRWNHHGNQKYDHIWCWGENTHCYCERKLLRCIIYSGWCFEGWMFPSEAPTGWSSLRFLSKTVELAENVCCHAGFLWSTCGFHPFGGRVLYRKWSSIRDGDAVYFTLTLSVVLTVFRTPRLRPDWTDGLYFAVSGTMIYKLQLLCIKDLKVDQVSW